MWWLDSIYVHNGDLKGDAVPIYWGLEWRKNTKNSSFKINQEDDSEILKNGMDKVNST